MNLMACRLLNLKAVYAGFLKTGMPLIAYDGTTFSPLLTGDDIGIYILIPKLARLLHISLDAAITIFFSTLLILPCMIAIYFFWQICESIVQKMIALAGILLLARQAYAIGDVYLCLYASALCIIPSGLYIVRKQIDSRGIIFYSLVIGLFVGLMHYIRAFSAIGPLLVAMILIAAFHNARFTKKLIFGSIFIFGFWLSRYCFEFTFNQAINYGNDHLGFKWNIERNHTFWHQVYLGFGLLNTKNEEDIAYQDEMAFEKARSIKKDVIIYSQEYESLLKNEVNKLFHNNLLFIFLTLFSKLGILFYFFLKFVNVGIIAAFFNPKPFTIDFAFAIGIAFNSLFSLIAIPSYDYALGFIACATLWAIMSLNFAISRWKGLHLELLTFFKKIYFEGLN